MADKSSYRSLESDQLIDVQIGTSPNFRRFYLQRTILDLVCEHFDYISSYTASNVDRVGILRLPLDNVEAWETLVYWIIRKDLPEGQGERYEDDVRRFVRCWALGEKYKIEQFQDEVMLELLNLLEEEEVQDAPYLIDIIEEAVRTTSQDSAMWRLMTETLVQLVYDLVVVDASKLDGCGKVAGVMGATMEAMERYQKHRSSLFQRFTKKAKEKEYSWESFLVGSAPKKHWIHDVHLHVRET